jgi:hypothetical protein
MEGTQWFSYSGLRRRFSPEILSPDLGQSLLEKTSTSLVLSSQPFYARHGNKGATSTSVWTQRSRLLPSVPLEEQDKVLRSYFAQKGGSGPGARGGTGRAHGAGSCPTGHVCVKPASQDRDQAVKSSLRGSMDMEGGRRLPSIFFLFCSLCFS